MQAVSRFFIAFLGKLSPWFMLAAISILCWYLASIVWLVIAPPKPLSLNPVPLSDNKPTSSFNPSIFNIFAKPKPPKPENTPAPPPPVAQPANMMLEGVMVASENAYSSAIISDNGKTKRYRVGETIGESEFILAGVSFKKATLEDNRGNTVELDIHKPFDLMSGAKEGNTSTKDKKPEPFSKSLSASSSSNMPPALPEKIKKSASMFAKKTNKKSVKEQVNDMLDKASSELQANPAAYMNKMGVMSMGDGYMITDQMNNQIRRNIGLQAGDKIISVNGQTLGNPAQDAAILDEVKRTGSAEIQVQRGAQVITVRQQF